MFTGKKLFALLLLSAAPLMAQFSIVTCTHGETGTCRQANSCSQANVQATISASSSGGTGYASPTSFDGDGVYIPAGSCSWASSNSWTNKNVNVIGANPTITLSGSVEPFDISSSTNGATAQAWHVSGITFAGSTSGSLFVINPGGSSETAWQGYFRIDNITNSTTSVGNHLLINGPVFGLIDHWHDPSWTTGNFIEQADFLASECVASPGNTVAYMGEYAWRTLPIALGTKDAIYIEDSTFNYSGSAFAYAISDSDSGGQRIVFRHNTVTGPTDHFAHWTRGGGGGFCFNGEIGGDKFEIYNNTYDAGGGSGFPMRFGAGTGVIFNNTIKNYTDPTIHLNETRGCGGEATNATMFDANGARVIDGNAGDASAPGWPTAGQIGSACIAGSCARGSLDSVPLQAWNNGTQSGCSTGGACTNSVTFTVETSALGSSSCTRSMPPYIKTTTHSVAGPLNGAKDICQGSGSQPIPCGIYNTPFVSYTYPHPLQVSGGSVAPPQNSVILLASNRKDKK